MSEREVGVLTKYQRPLPATLKDPPRLRGDGVFLAPLREALGQLNPSSSYCPARASQ
jgi:hypothetical protein